MKIGKTTLAVQFPRNLLLAVEHGYNAIDNVYAVDVPTWAEFKKYLKQLADEDIQAMFSTITIDTIGLLYERCTTYICDQNGVDKVGDIPFGAGYGMVDKEFEEGIRKITQIMDKNGRTAYGLCLIGHEKSRIDTDGQTSVTHITPDISDRCAKIINRMVDITAYIGSENGVRYIYPRQLTISEGKQVTEIYAGSHFYGLNDKIELSYDALVNAIADAMQVDGTGKTVKLTEAPVQVMEEVKVNFNDVKTKIGKIAKFLSRTDETNGTTVNMDEYKKIVDSCLGKGKYVKDCDESQSEHLGLILDDLLEYLKINGYNVSV